MIEECYGEFVQVGFLNLSTVDTMKTQDPIAWSLAINEYVDGLAQDDQIVSFDNGDNYYWIDDVEALISAYEEAA